MKWKIDNDKPIHSQLVEGLLLYIAAGTYGPGEKLPSVRDLAMEAKVNPNTMQKALAELETMGLIYTKRTSGKYVTDDPQVITNFKERAAGEDVDQFITKMRKLGFHDEQLLQYIKERMDQLCY